MPRPGGRLPPGGAGPARGGGAPLTASDTRAFSVAAVLILGASGLRYGVEARRAGAGLAWDSTSALPELLEESRAAQAAEARRSQPLGEGERLDPNTAPAEELDRLPGVGPSVARAIVDHREAEGAFRSAEDLLAVRGIGPATLEKIRERLRLPEERLALPPRAGPSGRGLLAPPGERDRRARSRRAGASSGGEAAVDVNRASAAELESLPGIGPALAARILERRERVGRFSSVEELISVRGIGPATLERLRGHVRAGR